MIAKLQFCLGLVTLFAVASSLQCRQKEDGMFEIVDGEVVIEPEPFDCISFSKTDSTTTRVTYLQDDDEGRKVCQVDEDATLKEKNVYIRSEAATGTLCEYVCKPSEGIYKCDEVMKPSDNACSCHPAEPRLLIHPTDSISGQSDDQEENKSCDDKEEGYQFDDPVPCSSMQGDMRKLRVDFKEEGGEKCSAMETLKSETRYAESSEGDFNLQGCLYVCKRAGPVCTSEIVDDECECRSPGLTKRLVPMDTLSVRNMLSQKRCSKGKCGQCGFCNEKSGKCELLENAHEGNHCECGAICPRTDLRAEQHKGGEIPCKSNMALLCMKKPSWLSSRLNSVEPGTRRLDRCMEGTIDAIDTCSCADGYMEQPGPFSGIFCVPQRAD